MNEPKKKKEEIEKTENNKLENEKPNKEIEELKKLVEENKNKYLRALADYQNLEKRVNEGRVLAIESAYKNVLLKLLPFLDNLEKAEIFVKDNGLKLIKDNFYKTLQEFGLEEIHVLNKPFDPFTAEAIDMVEGKEDNKVVEVLRKGYKFGDKVLRVAQVKVSKKIATDN